MFERASFHLDCLFAQKGGTKNHKIGYLSGKVVEGRYAFADGQMRASMSQKFFRASGGYFSRRDIGKGKRQNKKTEINFDVSACAGLCKKI